MLTTTPVSELITSQRQFFATGKTKVFKHAQCDFGYRDSFFKREGKGKYITTKVMLRVSEAAALNMT